MFHFKNSLFHLPLVYLLSTSAPTINLAQRTSTTYFNHKQRSRTLAAANAFILTEPQFEPDLQLETIEADSSDKVASSDKFIAGSDIAAIMFLIIALILGPVSLILECTKVEKSKEPEESREPSYSEELKKPERVVDPEGWKTNSPKVLTCQLRVKIGGYRYKFGVISYLEDNIDKSTYINFITKVHVCDLQLGQEILAAARTGCKDMFALTQEMQDVFTISFQKIQDDLQCQGEKGVKTIGELKCPDLTALKMYYTTVSERRKNKVKQNYVPLAALSSISQQSKEGDNNIIQQAIAAEHIVLLPFSTQETYVVLIRQDKQVELSTKIKEAQISSID